MFPNSINPDSVLITPEKHKLTFIILKINLASTQGAGSLASMLHAEFIRPQFLIKLSFLDILVLLMCVSVFY